MTDKPHTPTDEEMRRMYALKVPRDQRDRRNAEFDRFLSAAEQRGAERIAQAVQAVLDDYTMPGKFHDPTGITGAELETLEGYIREAITDAMNLREIGANDE